MKKALIPALLGLLFLSACSTTNGSVTPDKATIPAGSDQDVGPADEALPPADEEVDDAASDTRVIEMTVTDWEFAPKTISVKQGEKVVIRMTDDSGAHSLMIKDLGINVQIAPGQTVDVTIPTDTVGTFAFRCAVPCGPGHKEMTGTLLVEAA